MSVSEAVQAYNRARVETAEYFARVNRVEKPGLPEWAAVNHAENQLPAPMLLALRGIREAYREERKTMRNPNEQITVTIGELQDLVATSDLAERGSIAKRLIGLFEGESFQ